MSKETDKYYHLKLEWRRKNPDKIKEYARRYRDKTNKRLKVWRKNNRDKETATHNRYVSKNKEKVYEINKRWRENNKDAHLAKRRNVERYKIENDPFYKFSQNIRLLISQSFKRGKKNFEKRKHTEEILGCSIEEFREYILKKCPNGEKLEDFGQFGYHLDHIIPISSAKTEEDIIKLNHYTNFQPLWWTENLSKSNKIL